MTATGSATAIELPDLACRSLGGGIVAVSDEFFCAADNLIAPNEPTHRPHTFDAKGQVYDGWETRRRRSPGHEWVLLRLGVPGVVSSVVVDTAYFAGNYPQECVIEQAYAPGYPDAEALARAVWSALVPRTPLCGDQRHVFDAPASLAATHLRLSIYPDGGVARLRAYGRPLPEPDLLDGLTFDLAANDNGGYVVDCSDRFFGAPGNLLLPGVARYMNEGWETRRHAFRGQDDGDWVTVRLATEGTIALAELDTSLFKGNAVAVARLHGCRCDGEVPPAGAEWFTLLPDTPLRPDTRHRLRVHDAQPATHVRLEAFPDGGMARLRLFGSPTSRGRAAMRRRFAASTTPE